MPNATAERDTKEKPDISFWRDDSPEMDTIEQGLKEQGFRVRTIRRASKTPGITYHKSGVSITGFREICDILDVHPRYGYMPPRQTPD
ncbi:hypothetical protein CMI37_21245 [Candidatus Pacearchaeota archaeon]|nr:hypothetical protein [Candidatus Pacearchaeota archaeon]|tara:strand:- start:288 stop:551 length:264 start_codon:yes stop_codon:yes gene_type:complete